MIFLDTSAIYALADRKDPNHESAKERFQALLAAGEGIFTHNYVLLESIVLIQSRLGLDPAIRFLEDSRAFQIEWVDRERHAEAARDLKTFRRRRVSFVDRVSFLAMRGRGVNTAFAFDDHFQREGFRIFTAPPPAAGH